MSKPLSFDLTEAEKLKQKFEECVKEYCWTDEGIVTIGSSNNKIERNIRQIRDMYDYNILAADLLKSRSIRRYQNNMDVKITVNNFGAVLDN